MATARLGAPVRVTMPGRVEMRLPTLSSSIGEVSLTAAVAGRMVTEAWPTAAAARAAVGMILAARRTAAKAIRRLKVSAGIVRTPSSDQAVWGENAGFVPIGIVGGMSNGGFAVAS